MWRKALLVGRWMWPRLRRAAPIVLFLALALAVAAVWWFGPGWRLGGDYPLAAWQMRAMVTLGAVLLVAVIWGASLAGKLRRVDRSKQEAAREQEDPILPLERRQQRQLDRQLASLTGNLPGRHGRYRLPWYLLLGAEGAGKTSLIQRSGQTYTLTNVTREQRTDRNPVAVDWWVGDDGVLLDPDGALLVHGETAGADAPMHARLWRHFLRWLEQNRPQRPLNGVVVAVDLAALGQMGPDQRRAQAITLRTRLRELMEQLGSRLPVYVAFTKLDLLYGFTTLAQALTAEEKASALGFTFRLEGLNEPDDWMATFAERFDELVEGLNARLPEILEHARDPEARAAAFSFVRQLAGLRETLESYLADLLSADAFSTPALVRGTYFTSVLQEGVPEDPFVSAVAGHYDLPAPIQPAQRPGQPASLFTQRLFPDIIYPEAGLAGDNRKVAARRHRALAAASVVAVVAGVAMTAGWQHYFIKNAAAADAVQQRVGQFLTDWQPVGYEPDSTGRSLLAPLDQLREATFAFGDYHSRWPALADMGLYQGQRVGPEVAQAYQNLLAYQYLPSLMLGVMSALSEAPDTDLDRLRHLRVLRMLYDASGRRPALVTDYFKDYWQAAYPGQRDLQDRLMGHLQFALANTDLAGMAEAGDRSAELALAPFRSSVEWAQASLGQTRTPERVYRDLEQQAGEQLRAPLDLARASGPGFGTVFTRLDDNGEPDDASPSTVSAPASEGNAVVHDPLMVPALLTRQGLDKWFLKRSASVTDLALVDAWVLGRRDNVNFSDADEAQLRSRLQTLYAEHYAAAWRNALSHLDIRPFRDLNQGVRVLETLTSSQQPLATLLAQVQQNTRFIPPADTDDKAAQARRALLEQSPQIRMLRDIERQFAELNQLTDRTGEQPSGLDQIMKVITSLHQYLRNIQEAPDTGKAALEAARARLSLQGDDPIFTLQRMAEDQPAPLNRLLKRLADESWRVLLDGAVAQLEQNWYRDVYVPFQQTLARRYPLNPKAGRDAALQDFERFFAPDGVLATFYDQNLKLFLDEHPGGVSGAERASLVRRDVLDALDRAERIRKAYFTRSGTLDVEFALEPLDLSSNKRRSVMNLDGQLVEYNHGPRQNIPLVWPNTLRDAVESRVTLVPVQVNRSPRSVSESGPWALFRLLDQADLTGVSNTAVDVRFEVDGGDMRYRLHAASNTNPFTQRLLAGYRLPRSLY
ncbi:type VI secretion system membrane subunit TssM [Marinobacter sp. C2H3]|uniref:type VI secretion system membrane subunit TssM n=1 Tax=Marinobacter sp. C2H3 TaxID=3119003 RepID=UPI00300EAC4A